MLGIRVGFEFGFEFEFGSEFGFESAFRVVGGPGKMKLKAGGVATCVWIKIVSRS